MKIQLDTTLKLVKIESDIKISELINTLKKLLPNEWQEFTIQTNTIINNWSSPIYIEKHTYPTWPQYPWYCSGSNGNMGLNKINTMYKADQQNTCELKSGIYNVEL